MKPQPLDGRSIAAVLMTEDDGYYVVFGKVAVDDEGSRIDLDRGGALPLSDDALTRVKKVRTGDRELFGDAELWVPLSVGSVSDEDADAEGMIPTGLNLKEIAGEG